MKITVTKVTPITKHKGKEHREATRTVNKTFENKSINEIRDTYIERFLCHRVIIKYQKIVELKSPYRLKELSMRLRNESIEEILKTI
jgi:DNA-directed RNA polymerase subunit N (RpoN/RPB10)